VRVPCRRDGLLPGMTTLEPIVPAEKLIDLAIAFFYAVGHVASLMEALLPQLRAIVRALGL